MGATRKGVLSMTRAVSLLITLLAPTSETSAGRQPEPLTLHVTHSTPPRPFYSLRSPQSYSDAHEVTSEISRSTPPGPPVSDSPRQAIHLLYSGPAPQTLPPGKSPSQRTLAAAPEIAPVSPASHPRLAGRSKPSNLRVQGACACPPRLAFA